VIFSAALVQEKVIMKIIYTNLIKFGFGGTKRDDKLIVKQCAGVKEHVTRYYFEDIGMDIAYNSIVG
jgi:hypothetical protein